MGLRLPNYQGRMIVVGRSVYVVVEAQRVGHKTVEVGQTVYDEEPGIRLGLMMVVGEVAPGVRAATVGDGDPNILN